MVTSPRSRVDQLARGLRRLALVLLVLWVVAAVAAIVWVNDEFGDDVGFYRYITAVADVASFLIAAVLAYVGAALVETVGRVRSSIIGTMVEQEHERELRHSNPDSLAAANQPVDTW